MNKKLVGMHRMQKTNNHYFTIWQKNISCLLVILLMIMALLPFISNQLCVHAEEQLSSIQTSYYEDGCISVSLATGKMIVTVPETAKYAYIVVTFMNDDGEVPAEFLPTAVKDGRAEYTLDVQKNGIYYIQLYRRMGESNRYQGILVGKYSIAVKYSDGNASIITSNAYDNYKQLSGSRVTTVSELYYYLRPSADIQSHDEEIVSLSNQITGSETESYNKVLKIHDWVADNLYYDNDAVNNNSSWPIDAKGTLDTRKTVCEGYANLTAALLRAAGIPAKTVIGIVLTDDEEWIHTQPDLTYANHAWNEVYVNGRWVLTDVTWDSGNIFESGEFEKDSIGNTYFDNSLEFFSYSHLQTRPDDYDINYIRTNFSDINSHWAYQYIRFTVNNEFMNGVSGEKFAPNQSTTQAMFVTVLARLSGEKIEPASDEWYEPYVEWADKAGILNGIEEEFSANSIISRKMMASMIVNYINSMGINMKVQSGSYLSDIENIPNDTRNDIMQAVSWGLIKGRENGRFEPDSSLTRAEMTTVLTRIAEYQLMDYVG